MELSNKKELNQLDFLNNAINNNDHDLSKSQNKSTSNPKFNNQIKKIEKILILDTETTGLDENKDEIDCSNNNNIYLKLERKCVGGS